MPYIEWISSRSPDASLRRLRNFFIVPRQSLWDHLKYLHKRGFDLIVMT